MKMVASARVKRAENTLNTSRRYMQHFNNIIAHLQGAEIEVPPHPLEREHDEIKRIGILVLSSDRGLCGSYNSNVFRVVENFRDEQEVPVTLFNVGKKARDYFKRRGWDITENFIDISFHIEYRQIKAITDSIVKAFSNEEVDRIMIAYSRFHSPPVCRPTVNQLLPLKPPDTEIEEGATQYIFQPSPVEVLETFYPQYLHVSVVTSVAEAITSEQGQRMVAMTAATENAGEMIRALTLQYNKARQSAITSEILDIVGGAEALK